ncbi:MAG: DUF2914 domain-containing protein [Elusimicrobia bacterium]|nr:DUF2914 domain-containing protein [Elusimicrobiota bacterium]
MGIKAENLAVDSSGYIYVTGQEAWPEGRLPWVRKMTPDGKTIWSFTSLPAQATSYYCAGFYDLSGKAIAVDQEGFIYVTGTNIPPESCGPNIWIAKFDGKNGQIVWEYKETRANHLSKYSAGNAIVVDQEGHVYIGGVTNNPTSRDDPSFDQEIQNDLFVAKLDSTGKMLWKDVRSLELDDWATFLVLDGQNNVNVAGYTRPEAIRSYSPFLIRYSSEGVVLSSKTINLTNWLLAVLADRHGNFYVTSGSPGGSGFDLLKYNSAGELLQQTTYSYPLPGEGNVYANALDIDLHGNIYTVGEECLYSDIKSRRCDTLNIWMGRFSPLGTIEWTHTYQKPRKETDYGKAVVISSKGYLHALGQSETLGLWLRKFLIPDLIAPRTARETVSFSSDRIFPKKEGSSQEVLASGLSSSIRYKNLNYPVKIKDYVWQSNRLYFWTAVRSDQIPTHIVHIWYVEDKKVAEVQLDIPVSPYRTWSSKRVWSGKWRVEARGQDGKLLTSEEFRVKK